MTTTSCEASMEKGRVPTAATQGHHTGMIGRGRCRQIRPRQLARSPPRQEAEEALNGRKTTRESSTEGRVHTATQPRRRHARGQTARTTLMLGPCTRTHRMSTQPRRRLALGQTTRPTPLQGHPQIWTETEPPKLLTGREQRAGGAAAPTQDTETGSRPAAPSVSAPHAATWPRAQAPACHSSNRPRPQREGTPPPRSRPPAALYAGRARSDAAAQARRRSTGRRIRRWGRWIQSRGGRIRPAGHLSQPETGKKGAAAGAIGVEENGRSGHRRSGSARPAAAAHATRRPEEAMEGEGPEQRAAVKPHHGLSTRPERPRRRRPWELHGLPAAASSSNEAQLCWRGAAAAGSPCQINPSKKADTNLVREIYSPNPNPTSLKLVKPTGIREKGKEVKQ
ncbi:unnamed protein product [Miscanthus lutarioriparius]|uniref:Uncharacterized protein n=1 Tax=Miscanthus lutarioriparius TaxID=422564 RepID=A0A811QR75_9POAL|nr:unnamed protein product [Miscanthus lutarioriparius]